MRFDVEIRVMPRATLLDPHAGLAFVSRPVRVGVEATDTPFSSAYSPAAIFEAPVAHGEGRYLAPAEDLRVPEEEDRIVFRYLDNPNGSVHDGAGGTNAARDVIGLMPHPERVADPVLRSADGALVFRSLAQSIVFSRGGER